MAHPIKNYINDMIRLDVAQEVLESQKKAVIQEATPWVGGLDVGDHIYRKDDHILQEALPETAEVISKSISWDSKKQKFVLSYEIRKHCKDGSLHRLISRIASEDMKGWAPSGKADNGVTTDRPDSRHVETSERPVSGDSAGREEEV